MDKCKILLVARAYWEELLCWILALLEAKTRSRSLFLFGLGRNDQDTRREDKHIKFYENFCIIRKLLDRCTDLHYAETVGIGVTLIEAEDVDKAIQAIYAGQTRIDNRRTQPKLFEKICSDTSIAGLKERQVQA
jgi:hypothetical protein